MEVFMEKNMEKSANSKTNLEYPDDTDAKVFARMLDDMEFLGLIEFKADAKGGPFWVVAEQKPQAEPIKQDNVLSFNRRLG
jgi:hypothetical protein